MALLLLQPLSREKHIWFWRCRLRWLSQHKNRVLLLFSFVVFLCLAVLHMRGEITTWLIEVKTPYWRSVGGGARGERFRCLMVKDWSFLVDEGVFSVALPVSRIWSYFKTLDLLVSSLTLCLKSSPASVSSWFVCFPSRSGSSICCFLWGCSSLSHLSACGLCLIFWKCTWSSWGLELASWLLKFCWKR